jgi:hypothetical protein
VDDHRRSDECAGHHAGLSRNLERSTSFYSLSINATAVDAGGPQSNTSGRVILQPEAPLAISKEREVESIPV